MWQISPFDYFAGAYVAPKGISALSPNSVWVVCDYDGPGPGYGPITVIARRWDGTQWIGSTVSDQPPLNISDAGYSADIAAVADHDVWVVGYVISAGRYLPMTWHWDGSAWSPVLCRPEAGNVCRLTSIWAHRRDVWAVGYADGKPLATRWDGVRWVRSDTTQFVGYLNAVSGVHGDDVWAVGKLPIGVNSSVGLALHWNGGVWKAANTGTPDNSVLLGVTAIASDDVWAVGCVEPPPPALPAPIAVHWDGHHWEPVSLPDLGCEGTLTSVAAIGSTDVWAVGNTRWPVATLIEHWNGSNWTQIQSPVMPTAPNSNPITGFQSLYRVSTNPSTGDAWAVGTHNDPLVQALVMRNDSA
jgi:hypothetical protein